VYEDDELRSHDELWHDGYEWHGNEYDGMWPYDDEMHEDDELQPYDDEQWHEWNGYEWYGNE